MKYINRYRYRYRYTLIKTIILGSLTIGVLNSCTTTIPETYQPSQIPSIEIKAQVCFTPPQGCLGKIIQEIDNAQHTILVQAYSFTSKPIIDALIKAHKRKVKVKTLVDRTSLTSRGSKVQDLIDHGITVQVCKVPGIAHNKILIIDDETIITGSYNFTQAAETRNAENLLIIKDAKLAKQYSDNWYRLKQK